MKVKIDPDLLAQAKDGDPEAFNELFDLCSQHIFRYILARIGDPQLAEDLTGNVFLKVYEAINRGDSWNWTFTSWLYSIAHNQVVDYQRRQNLRAFYPIDEQEWIPSSHPDPYAHSLDCLDAEALRAAIARLPATQAQVICLRFLEGYGVREVATLLGKSELSIRALQFRAMRELRATMRKELG